MALRNGHGKGKGVPRVEVLPPDELPAGVPAPTRPAPARDASGRFLPSSGTRELARKGGRAAGQAKQLARLLGFLEVDDEHAFAPYARLAHDWRDDHMRQLAATVGGGEIGPGPAAIISSAALQLAASRYVHDRGVATASPKLLADASRLANDSRQNTLAAFELAAREAKARLADHHDRDIFE